MVYGKEGVMRFRNKFQISCPIAKKKKKKRISGLIFYSIKNDYCTEYIILSLYFRCSTSGALYIMSRCMPVKNTGIQ